MITPRCRRNWKCSCLIRWYLRIYFFTAGKKKKLSIYEFQAPDWWPTNTFLLFNQNVLLSVSRTASRSLINKPLSLLGQTGRTPGAGGAQRGILTSFTCRPDTTAAPLPCTQRTHDYMQTEEPQVRHLLLRKHLTETRQDSSPDGLPSRKQPADSEN